MCRDGVKEQSAGSNVQQWREHGHQVQEPVISGEPQTCNPHVGEHASQDRGEGIFYSSRSHYIMWAFHRCYSWVGLFSCFLPWQLTEFSGTMKARLKEIKLSGKIQLESSKSCVQCI